MSYRDYYALLEVAKDADQATIQKAYKRLARRYHPDLAKEADAEERFKEVGEAYEVLRDPKKRALYDRYGASWKAVSEGRAAPGYASGAASDFGAQGFNVSDFGDLGSLFETFFGGGGPQGFGGAGPRQRTRPRRPQAVVAPLSMPVAAAFRGGERHIQLADGRSLTVRIPAGVRTGQKVRLAGQGPQGADLMLDITVTDDSSFRFEGEQLVAALPLTPAQAALGASLSFETLDGEVTLKVPPGSSSGRRIRLRERGYPTERGRADLYAELMIRVPTELDDTQRALYEQLLAAETAAS